MNINERLFISWVGPRGIVAAGIASLFGLQLIEKNVPYAEYIVPLVFMTVLGTVLLNATTAKPLAKLLKITQDGSRGILIVGANELALLLGKYFQENGRHVVLVDSSSSNIRKAKEQRLEAIRADIFTNDLTSEIDLIDVGYLIALTSSSEVNNYAIKKFRKVFGENGTFRLLSSSEMRLDTAAMPETGVFSYRDDYFRFLEIVREYPDVQEVEVKSMEHLHDLIATMGNDHTRAPVLLKQANNTLDPIPIVLEELEITEKVKLVYLGKELEVEEEQKIENLEV
ncbi:MAG: NAD-binding protein, partial [Bacteroidota bacterium]